jgi:hypothetical protein
MPLVSALALRLLRSRRSHATLAALPPKSDKAPGIAKLPNPNSARPAGPASTERTQRGGSEKDTGQPRFPPSQNRTTYQGAPDSRTKEPTPGEGGDFRGTTSNPGGRALNPSRAQGSDSSGRGRWGQGPPPVRYSSAAPSGRYESFEDSRRDASSLSDSPGRVHPAGRGAWRPQSSDAGSRGSTGRGRDGVQRASFPWEGRGEGLDGPATRDEGWQVRRDPGQGRYGNQTLGDIPNRDASGRSPRESSAENDWGNARGRGRQGSNRGPMAGRGPYRNKRGGSRPAASWGNTSEDMWGRSDANSAWWENAARGRANRDGQRGRPVGRARWEGRGLPRPIPLSEAADVQFSSGRGKAAERRTEVNHDGPQGVMAMWDSAEREHSPTGGAVREMAEDGKTPIGGVVWVRTERRVVKKRGGSQKKKRKDGREDDGAVAVRAIDEFPGVAVLPGPETSPQRMASWDDLASAQLPLDDPSSGAESLGGTVRRRGRAPRGTLQRDDGGMSSPSLMRTGEEGESARQGLGGAVEGRDGRLEGTGVGPGGRRLTARELRKRGAAKCLKVCDQVACL